MKYIYTICFFLAFSLSQEVSGQARSENGHFLVELEQFSPPVRDMIKTFEGFPATPFLANDMTGEERYLDDFRGKVCVLYFWRQDNADAIAMLHDLNQLKKQIGKKLEVIAMSDDSREEITEFLGDDKMNIMVIPNTRMLSEAVYGVELGYPRAFIIDKTGIIQTVIPEQYFKTYGNHKGILENAIKAHL